MLRLACETCGRRGQFRIDRLLDRNGPGGAVPDLCQPPRRMGRAETSAIATYGDA